MSIESFLNKRLQKFSGLDFTLVNLVYITLSLLVFHFYPKLHLLDWWFYFTVMIVALFPQTVHLYSQSGNHFEKLRAYLQTNTSSNQMLSFIALFFAGLCIGVVYPVLTTFQWWIYLIVIAVLAIKPLTVSRVW